MSRRPIYALLLLLIGGAALFVALETDLDWLEGLNTYGNFDRAAERSFVMNLLPGTEDSAILKVYRYGEGIHAVPIFALLTIFVIFLCLRAIGSEDVKLGIARWLTAWAAFVVARFGVLRVSGVMPVRRCSYGLFPFLNCQACEMASGGCPIGSLQAGLMGFRFPLLPLVVLGLTGLALGRWICGWLCPFGLFSDIFDRISKRRFTPKKGWASLSFVVLGLVFVAPLLMGAAGATGWLPFCGTLCPSGIVFGLVPFWATTGVDGFAAAFTPGHTAELLTILFHLSLLALFVVLAVKISGRVFCKYLCPMGAFLGIFHRVSLVRVVHVAEHCGDCKKCVKRCPMQIDLAETDFLTQSNCIRCGRCVKLCPTDARQWVLGGVRRAPKKEPDLGPGIPVWTDVPR